MTATTTTAAATTATTIYQVKLGRVPKDAGQVHRMLARTQDGRPIERAPWRLDGDTLTLVGRAAPDWSAAAGRVQVREKPYAPQFAAGDRAHFKVRLTPYERHGHRIARILQGEAEWGPFLARLGEQHGFQVQAVAALPEPAVRINTQAKLPSVTFQGQLEVTDSERFMAALLGGIGRNKTHGFGLLLVARGG